MTLPPSASPPVPTAGAAPTCYRHHDRQTYISCVRCGRPICPDCMRPASVGFQCPEEQSAPAVRTLSNRSSLPGLARLAPVTTTLIGLNVAVFLLLVASGSSFLGSATSTLQDRLVQLSTSVTVIHNGAATAQVGVAEGDWWRIVTAMFVHFGIVHIGSNMLVLFVVGVPLERHLGARRFVAVYLLAGIGGGVATYLFASPYQISGGASGAIFGVLGAFAVVARRNRTAQLGSVTGTIVLNLLITFSIPGISITDHLGGLAVGLVLGLVLDGGRPLPSRPDARAKRVALQVAGFLTVAVVLVGAEVARTHVLVNQYGHGSTVNLVGAPAPDRGAALVPPPPPGD